MEQQMKLRLSVLSAALATSAVFAGTYSALDQTIRCMGRSAGLFGDRPDVDIAVYLDRTSIEIFVDQGLVQIANCFIPAKNRPALTFDGLQKLQIYELKSTLSR